MRKDNLTSISENQTVHRNQFESIPVTCHSEHIEASYPCEFTQTLLTSGLCSYLVSINLGLSWTSAPIDIFSQLKRVPNLKILNLSNTSISMDECEMIHNNLPFLKSFKIWTGLHLENVTLLNISPVYTIIAFELGLPHGEPNEQAQINWLQYIRKKHPNHEHLGFFMGFENGFVGDAESLYQQGYSCVLNSGNLKLKSLATGHAGENAALLKLLEKSGCQVNTLEFDAANVVSMSSFTQFEKSKL